MAKRRGRRSRKSTSVNSIQRDLSTIATRPRVLDDIQYSSQPRSYFPPVTNLDRRVFHPLGPFRPAVSRSGRRASVTGSVKLDQRAKSRAFKNLSSVIKFQIPQSVMICVRRKSRRQVLFARKKTRAGSRGSKSRNWFSSISCRR